MAKLVVVSPALAGLLHELPGGWVTIGRAHVNTFQIVESSISGRHCEVRLHGDELVVRDLLSTNGTFIQDKKISEAVLKPGQTLRLGNVELRLELSGTTASPATRNQVPPPAVAMTPFPSQQPAAAGQAPAGDDSTRKHHVLFVDDSKAFLETFSKVCSVFANHQWEIHSATTADRALAILQENAIELAVLDIGIPMVDGIQLLRIVRQRYPGLKIAVLTGNASENHRAACLSEGADLFIEKPDSPDGIRVVFNLLNDLISWAQREGFSGSLRQVGLPEVIQMECIGRHSSILEIRHRQLRGQIYIEVGTIVHATVETLVGAQAFFRLLSLKGGEFQVKPFLAPLERSIQDRWELLLMEAARVMDEETVLINKPPEKTRAQPAVSSGEKPAGSDNDVVAVPNRDGHWKPAASSEK